MNVKCSMEDTFQQTDDVIIEINKIEFRISHVKNNPDMIKVLKINNNRAMSDELQITPYSSNVIYLK